MLIARSIVGKAWGLPTWGPQWRRITELSNQMVEMGFPPRSSVIDKMLDPYLRDSSCRMKDEAVHSLFQRIGNGDRILVCRCIIN